MLRSILYCFLLLLSMRAIADEVSDSGITLEESLYKTCERFNVKDHFIELMNLDLYFDDIYFYALTHHRQEANFSKKQQCLFQKRQAIWVEAHKLLKSNDCEGPCAEYLLKKKDPLALKAQLALLTGNTQESNGGMNELSEYILCNEVFYIKDKDGYVNLRQQPNINADIIQPLKNGTKVYLLSRKDDWWHIALTNKQTGYIYYKSITVDPTN